MTIVQAIQRLCLCAGLLAVAAVVPGMSQPSAAEQPSALVIAQSSAGSSTPNAARKKPAEGDPPATTRTPPSASPSTEEATYKGQRLRALVDSATSTLKIELNGKIIGSVSDVGQAKKPNFMSGTKLTLVTIWTNTPRRDCSSYVLVAIPTAENGRAEVKSGFGACNSMLVVTTSKLASWEHWSLLAYRDDNPKVAVAVPKDGKLAIAASDAKPCLFARPREPSCIEAYVAAAHGSVARGVPSGDEQAGNHRLTTFHNSASGAGTLILNGRTFKTFSNIKVLYAEPSLALKDGAIFSVFVRPANDACPYRMILRMPPTGDQPQILDRVGACRSKSLVQTHRLKDNTVARWIKLMWGDNDRRVDIAYWNGDELKQVSIAADACLPAPSLTAACIDRLLPAELKAPLGQPGRGVSPPAEKSPNGPPPSPKRPPASGLPI